MSVSAKLPGVASGILAVLIWTVSVRADVEVPNGSFETGGKTPAGWTFSGKVRGFATAGCDGKSAIAVGGDGKSSGAWLSTALPLRANTVYRLRFRARRLDGSGGLATTGPVFCNRDLSGVPAKWQAFETYFRTPHRIVAEQARLRFGQWELDGAVAYDDVSLELATPVYASTDGLTLGQGERIDGVKYQFHAPLAGTWANCARPLAWHQCDFNSNRWRFSSTTDVVVYHHQLESRQKRARVDVQISWYAHGQLVVSASTDGQQWLRLGTLDQVGGASFDLPSALLPADAVWVRLTAEPTAGAPHPPSLQVDNYHYEATLDCPPKHVAGSTRFVSVGKSSADIETTVVGLGSAIPGANDNVVTLQVCNRSAKQRQLRAAVHVSNDDGKPATCMLNKPVRLTGGETAMVRIKYALRTVGPHQLKIILTAADAAAPALKQPLPKPSATAAKDAVFTATTTLEVPALYACDYGATLPQSTDAVGLWWCSSGWKVSVPRPLPTHRAAEIRVGAAANEAEAVQLVVRPKDGLQELRITTDNLIGPDGAQIPSRYIDVLRVRYVQVDQPTDSAGTRGQWPDPLPPIEKPIHVEPRSNQPLWLRIRVPKGTPAGTYRGPVQLSAAGYQQTVTLRVDVFGFTLPDRMTCQTAFGLNAGTIWRYHGLHSDSDRRVVLNKYLQMLAAHHISPYDPAPLDPIKLTWENTPRWSGGERDSAVVHRGNKALRLADSSTAANQQASFTPHLAIPTRGLKLSFWYRTREPGHRFLVSLGHYDPGNQWMSGRNRDVVVSGDGTWQHFEQKVNQFPAGARTVQLRFWATIYREDGSPTGTVWIDDVGLTDLATGKELVEGGNFEDRDAPTPKPRLDFSAWDRAMQQAIDRYHFNTFRLGVTGLGGGTFHNRYPPQLLGYSESTAQYKAAMADYLGTLQDHLRAKGWLDEAFVYWFDEPDPKDYEFVTSGFAKLKRWAPDLRRMLTEQVEPALVGGPNLWCPVSPRFDAAQAAKRRRAGDDFWWYICTGPKAPYCTLFIDHPATELRVWLWQTWQRQISGILVWSCNYWTSSAAYPDPKQPQNPYLDPMGWVSGYSTPEGTRRAWGNGDGRFIYPPEAAADGNPGQPILAGPVASQRLEMLRDGIEDYEYCVLLKRLLARHHDELTAAQRQQYQDLLTVPPEITGDTTSFTTDPAPIEQRRAKLAQAIEAVTRQLGR